MDSLQALRDPVTARDQARIIDIGTGGGFPGLPLMIARPGWTGILLDSIHKKAEAVDALAKAHLGERGTAVWSRAEELARRPDHREKYDVAFCRAVGRFTTVAELTIPFLTMEGTLLAHRGHEAPEEVAQAGPALEALGAGKVSLTAYDSPGLDKKRYIVKVVKARPTPSQYPRRVGVPAKRPL
jgi:16S rRNA (guanine527-N7)-methyltransferase